MLEAIKRRNVTSTFLAACGAKLSRRTVKECLTVRPSRASQEGSVVKYCFTTEEVSIFAILLEGQR